MTLDNALAIILGPKIAHDITMSQGQHWAIVAAMARAPVYTSHTQTL